MKKITVVGVGMGPATVTGEGLAAIERAEALFGAPRMLAMYASLGKPSFPEYSPAGVRRAVLEGGFENAAVLVSGDTGFFSAAGKLAGAFPDFETRLLPGISSLCYLSAKLGLPWQGAAIVSCHGRSANLADCVRRNALTFALTGGNVPELMGGLCTAGFGGLTVHVGTELGSENERVYDATPSELSENAPGSLSVLLIENTAPDDRARAGIADEEFIRGGVPMTKAEVRAVSMSALAIAPDFTCWDVGAGTGSVTVEMALAAWRGKVYAIDKSEEALRLVLENARRFHLGNIVPIEGAAPEALLELPAPNAVFVGGSGGSMAGIFAAALKKNPAVRITVNAIALESVGAALAAFAENGLRAEVLQLSAARAKEAGGLHLMTAQNPIYIISGGAAHE